MKLDKPLKYILMAFFAVIISKYLILWLLPPSSAPKVEEVVLVKQADKNTTVDEPQELNLTIDYRALEPKIASEYQKAQEDIRNYIDEALGEQKRSAYYNLSKDDGFLDWIFGYFTGYEMVWKKIKGYFGSDDNEIKLGSRAAVGRAELPGYDRTMQQIQSFTKNRTEDYYKNVIAITSEYLKEQTEALKQQGFKLVEIDTSQIPWSKYMVSTSADGFALLELTGVTGVSVFVGKFVGAKVATLLGPKVLNLIAAKTASVIAGKIAAAFSLIFAPIVDLAVNEGAKQLQYESTKKEFEEMIDIIFTEIQQEVETRVKETLQSVRSEIYRELNRETNIKASK